MHQKTEVKAFQRLPSGVFQILSIPFVKRCLSFRILSRSMSTENDLNSSFFDPIQDKPLDPILLEEGKSVLAGNRLEVASKFPILLRKMVGQICGELSPQESFEFRLQSRIDFRHVPCYANASPVEQGFAYHVTGVDWLSLDGEEIRKFVEDDNRYNVDWGNFFDFNDESKSGTVVFMPKDPLPHMARLNESNDSSASDPPPDIQNLGKPRKRYYSPSDFYCPTDPLVEKKAELLCDRAVQARKNIVNDYFKQMEGVWAMMSPKGAFTSRFKSWSDFRDGPTLDKVDENKHFYTEDGEEYFPKFQVDDKDSIGTVFHIQDAHYEFPDEAFKEFLESDDRYIVHWGSFKPMLTWCGHKYRYSDDSIRGFIRFMPKSVKPKRKKIKTLKKNDEIDDEEDNDEEDGENENNTEDNDDDENKDIDEDEDDDEEK
jgi:hypothetical protein